jgi:hypothetical protein
LQNFWSIAGRAIGMLAGGATAALWVTLLWGVEIDGFSLEGIGVAVGALLAIFGLVAAIASWHGHAVVVFVCFVASFFGVGTFALNVDNWFRIFGILDLLLLAASAMIWFAAKAREKERQA